MNGLSVLLLAACLSVVYSFGPGNNGGFGGSMPNIPSTPGISGGNDRGTWNVGVNKDKGRGPQIHADAQGRAWESKNGNVHVDVGGSWDAGKGRKPSYGTNVNVGGRWKRSADPGQPGDRGSVSVTREQQRGQKPRYNAEAQAKLWESRDKRGRLDAHGNYNWGGNQRPNYGAGIRYTHRFRREADLAQFYEE